MPDHERDHMNFHMQKKILMNTDYINNPEILPLKEKLNDHTAIVNRHALCNRFMVYVCLNLFNHVSARGERTPC